MTINLMFFAMLNYYLMQMVYIYKIYPVINIATVILNSWEKALVLKYLYTI